MAGSAVHSSSFKAVFHTAAIAAGDFSSGTGAGTQMGNIVAGSISVDRQENVQSGQGVSVSVGATRRITLEVYGTGSAMNTAILAAKNANPPTVEYLFITNISGKGYTQYGPGNFETANQKGKGGDAVRQSYMVVFYAEGDTVEDIVSEIAATIQY